MKLIYLILFSVLLFTTSCKESNDEETKIEFSKKDITIKIGDTATLLLKDNSILNEFPNLTITIKNPTSINIIETNVKSFRFSAEEVGANTAYLRDSGVIKDSCVIHIADPNLIKILAIGNSFSEDAVEFYLYDLLKEKKQDVVIGNAMIPGCNLATHLNNGLNNLPLYSYRKINLFGEKTVVENQTLGNIIRDEDWDFISFQQASPESGKVETFINSLPQFYNYIKSINQTPKTKYLLHQTWAYASNSTHPGFAYYNNDQMVMYNAIINSYKVAINLIPIYKIVPSGTAIQNARTSSLGNNLTRDGYHLDYNIGRFIAAGAWYETLTGRNILRNNYNPSGMLLESVTLSKKAVHAATVNPFQITEIK